MGIEDLPVLSKRFFGQEELVVDKKIRVTIPNRYVRVLRRRNPGRGHVLYFELSGSKPPRINVYDGLYMAPRWKRQDHGAIEARNYDSQGRIAVPDIIARRIDLGRGIVLRASKTGEYFYIQKRAR